MTIKQRAAGYTEYVFKCMWDATAVKVIVPGKNYIDACRRVESLVRRMEGGACCKEISFVRHF